LTNTINITTTPILSLYGMATTMSSILYFPIESHSISITWPPPCTPMHLMEGTLPSLHMATNMYIKYIKEPRSISFTWLQPC